MGKTLYMFPGQGSQSVGMGKDLHENEPAAKELFDMASEHSGIDIARLCFEGPAENLKMTENAQPALLTCSYAACTVLRQKGLVPDLVAGHSLGEYTAVAASGMLPFKSAVELVSLRGRLMGKAGLRQPGTMAAIIGLEDAQVEALCKEVAESGIVVPANYNSPGQVVISGETQAVEKAMESAKAKGAKRALPLPVSGAFHSPLMEETIGEFKEALQNTRFIDATIPVISNVSGEAVTSGEQMRDLLLKQLNSPVKWTTCMATAASQGVDTAVEVGPGKVLAGLLKRINSNITVFGVENSEGVAALVAPERG